MELFFFLFGLLPYTIETYFLRKAFDYKKPESVESFHDQFVSVHVPIHKEPPEVVLQTLESLKNKTTRSMRC